MDGGPVLTRSLKYVTDPRQPVTGRGDGADHLGTLFEAVLESGPADENAPLCAHCGHHLRGSAFAGDAPLCHPDRGQDCYRLVTVYQHPMPCESCRAVLIGLAALAERLRRRD